MSFVSSATAASRRVLTILRQSSNYNHRQYNYNHHQRHQIKCSSSTCFLPSPRNGNDKHEEQQDNLKRQYLMLGSSSTMTSTTTKTTAIQSMLQSRHYSTTYRQERSGATLVLGFGALAATAKAGQYAVRAYEEWKESQPSEEEIHKQQESQQQKQNMEDKNENQSQSQSNKKETSDKRENIFSKYFNLSVGSKYYEGGFDDKMTRREAALILGVRESSTAKRIKEAHRKLLILNHPDTGGSTYISGKLNEAKELLLKGKTS